MILYKSLGRPVAKAVPLWAGIEATVHLADVLESQGVITIPIIVERRPDVCAADVRLSYDPSLVRPTEVRAAASDVLLVSNIQKEGQIIAALVNPEGLVASDGSLLLVSFELKGEQMGQNVLHLEQIRLFDPSAEPIKVRVQGELSSTEQAIPQTYGLSQNVPNPFNANTVIRVQLPHESKVTLRVYNLTGQVVRTLVDGRLGAGEWRYIWDGRDEEGAGVASGVYIYRLVVGDGRWTKTMKMILLR